VDGGIERISRATGDVAVADPQAGRRSCVVRSRAVRVELLVEA
jgi:hypothetical protein